MPRVLGVDIPNNKPVYISLAYLYGIGPVLAVQICFELGVDPHIRAGELTEDEVKTVNDILANPINYNIPKWFLNRQRDPRSGQYSQLISNALDTQLREDLERMRRSK